MEKLKIGFLSLTGCEGCEFVILQLYEKLLKINRRIEIVSFRLISSKKYQDSFDIFFIDGSITTKEEENIIKEIRNKSKILIALGSCATDGGVNIIRNIMKNPDSVKLVYRSDFFEEITKETKPIDSIVKVDYKLSGCPISIEELEHFIKSFIKGEVPKEKIINYAVCNDCIAKGIECVTKNGIFCAGPLTKGGCGAICPSFKVPCFGCRGPSSNLRKNNLKEILEQRIKNGGIVFTEG
ncbi:MAG: NADH:ubiquinone oxidoreductase [Nitrososphaerota archaeon]